MNRQKIILSATILLVVFSVVYWVWSNWGLITVDVNGKPLSEVIRSIEKQGHIVLKTNMDAAKPVSMHVYKVPLTEALETLASVTDSRWRLGYFFAPNSGAVKGALDSIAGGKRPEGWKNFDVPLFVRPGSLGDQAVPMDPRRDTWAVTEPQEKTLQAFLQAAATGVSASFTCPEDFNPAVTKAPSSGAIRKSAPQLAKIANAKVEEVFLLMGRPPGAETADAGRDRDDDFSPGPPRGRGGPGGRGPNPQMRERALAEIAKLPPSEQPAAKAEFEERDKFFTAMRDLPDEERRAKMEEFMSKPENQERMADRQAMGGERKTPEQRIAKYQNYVAKKQAAKAAVK
jgi:hypothetical protein